MRAITLLAMLSGWVSWASAVELANFQYPTSGGSTSLTANEARFWVEIGDFNQATNVRLFEGLSFPLGSHSGTFIADASSDPDFAAFEAKLTDGTDNIIWGMTVTGGGGQFEYTLFGGHDLMGWDITSVTLDVLSLTVLPNQFTLSARIMIDGELMTAVPEPETYAMLLAGLALLGFASRRTRSPTAAA